MKEVFELLPEAIRGQIRILFQRVWQTIGKEKSTRSLLDNIGRTEDMGFIPSRNASFALYKGSMCYADSLNYANITALSFNVIPSDLSLSCRGGPMCPPGYMDRMFIGQTHGSAPTG